MIINYFLNHYTLITHLLEFLAAGTGAFCLKRYNDTTAKFFVYFLFFIAISDTLTYYTYYVNPNRFLNVLVGTKFEKNFWWTTLYWDIGAILFFVFFFNKILKTKYYKKTLSFLGVSYFFYSITLLISNWDAFFNQFFIELNLLGALIIFLCTTFYFTEVLLTDEILKFYQSLNFYISVTIFIWWLVITPLAFYDVYYTYEKGKTFLDSDFIFIRFLIYLFANIFMYLTFTFALIWCRPEKN